MKKNIVFLDIDTQQDFINPYGKLCIENADRLKQNFSILTNLAKQNCFYIMASVDSHSSDDKEFEIFEEHCVKGTSGQEKIKETSFDNFQVLENRDDTQIDFSKKRFIIEKSSLDIFDNPNTERLLLEINPKIVCLYGVATDYCVKYAVEGLLERGYFVQVILDAVKGFDEEESKRIIKEFELSGVRYCTTEELVKGLYAYSCCSN